MSFDDLSLLLGVIEIQVVLHILVHGLQFPMLQCDIFTYSVRLLIHSILWLWVMWNLFMCSLDHCSMYYNCFTLHLASCVGEVCLDLFPWWVHWLFPLFCLPCSYEFDHCSYGLGPNKRKRFYVNALVTTHVCFIMVFVSHVDMIFSWMVSTPAMRWVALMVQIFLVVEHV
jgi:hypothetical protein